MQTHGVDAYIILSTDEHLNEYLPQETQRRAWASGFEGSAGDFLVTRDSAWLFADSRYHEQAEHDVAGTGIQLSKLGLPKQPSLGEKLTELIAAGAKRVGCDPWTVSREQSKSLAQPIEKAGGEWVSVENLVDALRRTEPWNTESPRPDSAVSPVYTLAEERAGVSVPEKLAQVRAKMQAEGAWLIPVAKLDQIAWLFNLRGADVDYNPVFIAYALVTPTDAFLFTRPDRIQPEAMAALEAAGVRVAHYSAYNETLRQLLSTDCAEKRLVWLDPKHTTQGTADLIRDIPGAALLEKPGPLDLLKACKNPVEIRWIQEANLKASRAKIRLLTWLDDQEKSDARPSEWDVKEAMEGFYRAEAEFCGLSFNTIAAAGPNSSVVHYGTPSPEVFLTSGQFLLIDSGSHYRGGTTDDTRTVIFGTPDAEQKCLYTLVLKAHIDCARQRFPQGTMGIQLDSITRAALWQAGLDFGHGTGHGVGAFLNVHEGPNGIHRRAMEPFQPGMVTSIEPGYYRPGWGGIRLENLALIVESGLGEGDIPWYAWEPLTYIPFDKKLIDFSALSSDQLDWLRQYHQAILEKTAPGLDEPTRQWLSEACRI